MDFGPALFAFGADAADFEKMRNLCDPRYFLRREIRRHARFREEAEGDGIREGGADRHNQWEMDP